MYHIQTTISKGGYIVVGDQKLSRGYWFNPVADVFEYNEVRGIDPLNLLRCNGATTKLSKSELENRLMKDLLANPWVYIYRYGNDRSSFPPAGFEMAEYICEVEKGKWGVFSKNKTLISLVPSSTAEYLHAYVEIPFVNNKNFKWKKFE